MSLFAAPLAHPVAWWVMAALISLFHAVRAVLNQRHWIDDENKRRGAANPPLRPWSFWERIVIHQAHDFLFHIVCCMSGFLAAYVFATISDGLTDLANIGVGTAILMSFLAVVAVAGVTGVLLPLLVYGKLWGRIPG